MCVVLCLQTDRITVICFTNVCYEYSFCACWCAWLVTRHDEPFTSLTLLAVTLWWRCLHFRLWVTLRAVSTYCFVLEVLDSWEVKLGNRTRQTCSQIGDCDHNELYYSGSSETVMGRRVYFYLDPTSAYWSSAKRTTDEKYKSSLTLNM